MNSENLVASLCVSIKSGNVAEVERVLQLGVDPNSPSSDWARSRPLILAAASGHPDILAALLAHPDLDPNLADGMSVSKLHLLTLQFVVFRSSPQKTLFPSLLKSSPTC